MIDVCSDDRFELIEKAKDILTERTNIKMRPEEMAVIDNILFRCWQVGWLDQLRDSGTSWHGLLPCPLCGGEASRTMAHQREDGIYYPAACGCHKCGIWRYGDSDYGHYGFATEDDYKKSMEQAVSRWNTRMAIA